LLSFSRLLRELKEIQKSQHERETKTTNISTEPEIVLIPQEPTNLYTWNATIEGPPETRK
jgi:ubiquitin-protein ligase